jgi:hypothetical protein
MAPLNSKESHGARDAPRPSSESPGLAFQTGVSGTTAFAIDGRVHPAIAMATMRASGPDRRRGGADLRFARPAGDIATCEINGERPGQAGVSTHADAFRRLLRGLTPSRGLLELMETSRLTERTR